METTLSNRAKLITFWVLAGITVFGLAHFFNILTPFLWAAITAYVFQPLINIFVRRLHLPRPFVAGVIYLAIVAAIVLGALTVWPILRQQGPELVNQVPGIVETSVTGFEQRFPELTQQLGLDPAALEKQAIDPVNQLSSAAPRTALTVAQRLCHAQEATRLGITLSAVAVDPIAGSLCTAVGMETTIIGAESGRQLTLTGQDDSPTFATVELIAKLR